MKFNVTGGTLYYGGAANVVNVNGSDAGKIFVNGAANVEGSTASATGLFSGESAEILTATSGITGNLKNSSTPEKISGMMSAKGSIVDNSIIVTTEQANNLGELNRRQAQAFNAGIGFMWRAHLDNLPRRK